MTPYTVTFRAFSPEIAQVLAGFASSPHGFIVKSINVQPAGAAGDGAASRAHGRTVGGGGGGIAAPARAGGRARQGGLQTVLNEQLLRVTWRLRS